jgi:hypothetical protein
VFDDGFARRTPTVAHGYGSRRELDSPIFEERRGSRKAASLEDGRGNDRADVFAVDRDMGSVYAATYSHV